MSFFIFMGIWAAINILATRKVLRSAVDIDRRGMIALMPWVAPFVGALVAYSTVRSHERAIAKDRSRLVKTFAPAPMMLSTRGNEGLFLDEIIELPNGFPMFHWSPIESWLAQIADPEERRLTRIRSQRVWLEHLREALGPHYMLHETEDAFVLSSLEDNVAVAAGTYVSSTRRKISRLLGNLAHSSNDRKSVLLILDDEETYYSYVSIFYPEEGEFSFSGGMFIQTECPHFVVPLADLAAIEPVIAHELTHSAVAHLRLPVWLDEGIAVNAEQQIAGTSHRLQRSKELRAKHLSFWNPQTIQEFWSGAAFFRPDDGNALSYDLARILVEHSSHPWESFEAFVSDAARSDSGAASAATHLGVNLGAVVCAWLECEPTVAWSPEA